MDFNDDFVQGIDSTWNGNLVSQADIDLIIPEKMEPLTPAAPSPEMQMSAIQSSNRQELSMDHSHSPLVDYWTSFLSNDGNSDGQVLEMTTAHHSTGSCQTDQIQSQNPPNITLSIFACTLCGRTFKHKRYLIQHHNAKHVELNHLCNICGKRFRQQEDLEKHKIRHDPENKGYACVHCAKKFNYWHDMIRHVQAVHTEKPLKCNYCVKRWVRADHLVAHEKSHRKE